MAIKWPNFNQEGTEPLCAVEILVQVNDAWTVDILPYAYVYLGGTR
jgi:hypothetical protein